MLLRIVKNAESCMCLLLLVTGAFAGSVDAQSPPGPLKVWAVVVSPELEPSGVDGLISAELSKRKDITLVERQQIRTVAKAMEIEVLLAAAASTQRVKVGRLLKADALVVVSKSVDAPDATSIVICQTDFGARLSCDYIPTSENPAELCQAVVQRVEAARRRFPQGVERIFALAPFQSDDLVHRYDYLQNSLPQVLSSFLAAGTGVAVLETAEAQAIRAEVELTGSSVRAAVAFVTGSFRMKTPTVAGREIIDLKVDLTVNEKIPLSVKLDNCSLSAAADRLRETVGKKLLAQTARSDAAAGGLSAKEQRAILSRQADAFALLGQWEKSTALREAALMVDPTEVQQRLKLVNEYGKLMAFPFPRAVITDQAYAAMVRMRCNAFIGRLNHLEYLICNKLVDATEIEELLRGQYSLGVPHGPEMAPAEEFKRRFLLETYPKIYSLSRTFPKDRPYAEWEWLEESGARPIGWAIDALDRGNPSHRDLDFLGQVMTEIVPEISTPGEVRDILQREPTEDLEQNRKHQAFLEKLTASKCRVVQIWGRYGLLYRKSRRTLAGQPADVASQVEAQTIWDQYEKIPMLAQTQKTRRDDLIYYCLKKICRHLTSTVPQGPPEKTIEHEPERVESTPRTVKLLFEPVKIMAADESGKLVPLNRRSRWSPRGTAGNSYWLACGDSLDVVWGKHIVLFLNDKKGVFREVLSDPNAEFLDLAWDGRNIWIVTRNAGIWLLNTSGKVFLKVGADQGLPPSDRGLCIFPVAPGKVLAVGSFGDHARAWCAMLQLDKESCSVRVFHEARHVPDSSAASAKDTKLAFVPIWIIEHTLPGKARTFLVKRNSVSSEARYFPLAINLDTLDVSVFPGRLYSNNAKCFFSRNGQLLESTNLGLYLHGRPGGWGWDWEDKDRLTLLRDSAHPAPRLWVYNGRIYRPGRPLRRINPETWQVEKLECRYDGGVVSANYGMLFSVYDAYFRHVGEESLEKQPPKSP